MPEEPDVSPGEMEILDRNIRKRIEAKERLRAYEMESIANRIMEALQSRPEGMNLAEIREMFDKNLSDKQIKQVLQTLKTTALTGNSVKATAERTGDRWVLLVPAGQRFELILVNWEISRSTARLLQGATPY